MGFRGDLHIFTMGGPQTIAKLVSISPIAMVYYTYNYSIHGVYKPIYNWGGATLYTYLGPYNRGVFERIGRIPMLQSGPLCLLVRKNL